ILEEELQRPALSREQILFWFEQFRQGDVNSPMYQRQIIDNFVNSVYIFEDRVVLNFNFKEHTKTVTLREVLGSSADGNGLPEQKPEATGPGFLFCTGIAEAAPVRVLYCCAAEPRPQDNHNCIGQQKGRASAEGVSAFLIFCCRRCAS